MTKRFRLILCIVSFGVAPLAFAIDCPKQPQEASTGAAVAVEATVGRLGPLKAGEARANVQKTTSDLLATIPSADQLYLTKMLYAAYCSSIDQDKSTSAAEKSKLLLAYNREVMAVKLPSAPAPGQGPAPAPAPSPKPKPPPSSPSPSPSPSPSSQLPDIRGESFRMLEEGMYLQPDNKVYGCNTYLRTNGVLAFNPDSDRKAPSGTLTLTVTRQRYFTGEDGSFYDLMGEDKGHSREHCNSLQGYPTLQVQSNVYISNSIADGVRFAEVVLSTTPGIDPNFRFPGQHLGGQAVIEPHKLSISLGDRRFVK